MFGLTEFRFSLYTPNRIEAKHLSQAINKFVQQIYLNIRQERKMSINQNGLSTLSKNQLQKIIKQYVKDFIHEFELEQATGSRMNPYSQIDQLRGYDWVLSEEHDTLAERRHVKKMTPEVDEVLGSMGMTLDKSSDDYHLLCYLLLKARIRSLEACKSRLEHKLQGHTIDDILKDLDIEPIKPIQHIQIPTPTTSEAPSIKFKEVIEAYWNDRSPNWKSRSLADYETSKKNLLEYFNDMEVRELDYYKMKNYRDQLSNQKTAKNKPLSISRINFYLGFAKAVCNFEMKTTGILKTNPVEGLHLKDTRRKDELREVFTKDDLSKLFVKSKEYGQEKHRTPERFWIPLLALYTGCRMEELCQLYVDQVIKIDGVWCLRKLQVNE